VIVKGGAEVRFFLLFIALFAACVLSSCATVAPRTEEPAPKGIPLTQQHERQEAERLNIVEYAESLLGRKDLKSINRWFRNDCSGYVLGVYQTLGYRVRFPVRPPTRQISLLLHHVLYREGLTYTGQSPNIADVVFFTGTVDPGLSKVSHVGIVSGFRQDGTIRILNYTSRGVTVLHMNLDTPSLHRNQDGEVKNDFLRKKITSSDNGKVLSGELFCCFGDLVSYCRL
jgi:hypothetical protein